MKKVLFSLLPFYPLPFLTPFPFSLSYTILLSKIALVNGKKNKYNYTFMKEQGIVIDISGDTVKIRLVNKPECAMCGICSGAFGGFQILSLKTKKPVQINQIVNVEINPKIMTLSTILLYGAPLAGFVAGAILGYIIGKEILAVILGTGLLITDLFMAKIIIRKMRLSERIADITE